MEIITPITLSLFIVICVLVFVLMSQRRLIKDLENEANQLEHNVSDLFESFRETNKELMEFRRREA